MHWYLHRQKGKQTTRNRIYLFQWRRPRSRGMNTRREQTILRHNRSYSRTVSKWPIEQYPSSVESQTAASNSDPQFSILVISATPTDQSVDRTFDYLGPITGVAGLILINAAWNQAPILGWSTLYVYVLLILGFHLRDFHSSNCRIAQSLVPRGDISAKTDFCSALLLLVGQVLV